MQHFYLWILRLIQLILTQPKTVLKTYVFEHCKWIGSTMKNTIRWKRLLTHIRCCSGESYWTQRSSALQTRKTSNWCSRWCSPDSVLLNWPLRETSIKHEDTDRDNELIDMLFNSCARPRDPPGKATVEARYPARSRTTDILSPTLLKDTTAHIFSTLKLQTRHLK